MVRGLGCWRLVSWAKVGWTGVGLWRGSGERLGRTGCLGHAVGVLGGPLSEGEEMGWAEVWQLGPG